MSFEIFYTQKALTNLESIYSYIADDLQAPENAKRTTTEILNGVDSLTNMPSRNPLYDKEPWRSMGMRKLIVKNYIIFYLTNLDDNKIIIIRVVYGKRDISKVLDEK